MNLSAIQREMKELPLGLIDEPALPSRGEMDEQLMDELTASIRANGVIAPISVARLGDRFEVIAGHRRRIASGRAGLVGIPCVIYPSKEVGLLAIQYAENRHREDLNPADEAIWFNELLERDCGGDVDVLCDRLGEKRGYVEGRLLLFRGDLEIFEKLRAGKITIGVAQQLNRCTDQIYRRYLLHQAIVGGATIAVVSGWINDWDKSRRDTSGELVIAEPAAAPSAIPETHYFTCCVCQGTDNVHLMVPVNVHQHCKLAILDKLLATYRGD